MFAQLGDIVFEIKKSPVSMNINGEAVYAEHELIDRKSRLQRTGSTLDKVDLSLVFDASFCNPSVEIKRLKAYRSSGEILYFVWGNGEVVGRFVITTIDESIANNLPDGTILRLECSVSLLEYEVYDEKIPERQLGITQAKALDTDGLLKYEVEKIGKVDARALLARDHDYIASQGLSVSNAITNNNGLLSAIDKINITTSLDKIKESGDSFKANAATIADALNRNDSSVSNYVNGYVVDLVSNTNGVAKSVEVIKNASDSLRVVLNGPVQDVLNGNSKFKKAVTVFRNVYSGLRKYTVLRK